MIKHYNKIVFLVFVLIVWTSTCFANNLTIADVSLVEPNTTDETVKIQFDIIWENSWRNNTNHDAAWVFAKYSTDSGSTWKHATLKTSGTNPSGFSTGVGTSIELIVPSDKMGCFIQRDSPSQGTVTATQVQLVWDWGADGLDVSTSARIKVVGIEMVYVPQGPLYLGDGNGTSESTYSLHEDGTDNAAVQIATSSKDITCDTNTNDDIDTTPIAIDGDGGITGNPNFPTGYNAFYLMKYEISEYQWVDFFNSLTPVEKANRDITGSNGKNSDSVINRNTISWSSGNAATDRGDRSCSYLSWMDLSAYADWTALRPMTELEYEKAARGAIKAEFGEYAWGNTSVTAAAAISGTEDGTETVSSQDANCCYNNQTFTGGDGGTGPVRNGIFATSSSTRVQAGAGYFGVMELSGNLQEMVVTVGNSGGRDFAGSHGDGALSSANDYEGNATNTDWSGIDGSPSRGVTGATGSGLRGGGWDTGTTELLRTSDRANASSAVGTRGSSYGGRCARTAP